MSYPILQKNSRFEVTETMTAMSDGVHLYTRISVPVGGDTYPVVLIRTPYEEARNGDPFPLSNCDEDPFLTNGFAVVLQHCRGRGDSEGDCIPYGKLERKDGLETLDFVRGLPLFNGEIFLFGGSYLSTVHLLYLGTRPANIRGAALSIQTDRMFFRNYRHGCCYNFCGIGWYARMMGRKYPDAPVTPEQLRRPYIDIAPRVFGEDVPYVTAMLRNTSYNAFWQDDPRTDVVDALDFPVLFTEGWYDFYLSGMFSMWDRLPQKTKEQSAFLVGPWGHATAVADDADYPIPDGNIPADFAAQWFRSIRTGTPCSFAERGKLNYYSVGGNHWDSVVYPLSAFETQRLYFSADGALTATPAQPCTRSYTYDPEAATLPDGLVSKTAAVLVPKAAPDSGILSFSSAPFEADTDFLGSVRWQMDVRSDCEDTAFMIRLLLSEPAGDFHLTETIAALHTLAPDYIPGTTVHLNLELPPMAFTVKKGCALRVDISSSGGLYVPHANVRGHWAEVTEIRIARNTLLCNSQAFLDLPLRIRSAAQSPTKP